MIAILFPFNTISAQNDFRPTIKFDHLNYTTEKMNCNYYDTGKISAQDQAQKKAIITVTDPSADKSSTAIDRVTIFVWSDSDKKGIEITAYETEVNSGIFKGTVTISEGQSTQGVIHVSDGDALWAKYAGTTPWTPDTTNSGITATVFVGALCAPLERVPAFGIKISDSNGNELKTVLAGKQIQIGSNLSNPTIRNQNFTYIVQIYDKDDNNPESLSWLSGVLLPSKTLSPAVSWTPPRAGSYTVQVFVWQSISNPNSLSPPLSTNLIVLPGSSTYGSSATSVENIRCYLGYEPVIKPSNNSAVCVTSQTAQKLVERGWRMVNILSSNGASKEKDRGTLSGKVVLAGGPSSGPKANYEVDVYATDGVTVVGKTFSDANARYSIQLPAGDYIIYVQDYPTPIRHLVSIFQGKTTMFDIVYGMHYR